MVKWGGAVVTALLVVVWVGSGWWNLYGHIGPSAFAIGNGVLAVPSSLSPYMLLGWGIERSEWIEWRWWFGEFVYAVEDWYEIPLWLVVAGSTVFTGAAWRLDTLARRRARLNLCPTGECNYDRTGLVAEAVCPECGAASA